MEAAMTTRLSVIVLGMMLYGAIYGQQVKKYKCPPEGTSGVCEEIRAKPVVNDTSSKSDEPLNEPSVEELKRRIEELEDENTYLKEEITYLQNFYNSQNHINGSITNVFRNDWYANGGTIK